MSSPCRSRSSSTSWPATAARVSSPISPAIASSSAAWWWASSRPRRRSATRSSNEAVGWSGPTSRHTPLSSVRTPASRAVSTSWRSTPGFPIAASRRRPATRATIGPPSTRWRSVSMLSIGSGSTVRRRRCPSLTRWSNGVGPPVVRIVRTANTPRDCTSEATSARDSSSSWSPSSTSRSRRSSPARSRSAAAARWKTAPRSRSSAPVGEATSTGSRCDSAANGIDRPSGCPLARALGMPAASASSRTFSASRVLPTPAPPVRNTPAGRAAAEPLGEHLELAAAPDHRPRRGQRRFDEPVGRLGE